jgi:hypothetical protein
MPTSSAIPPRRSAVSTKRALRRWACSWLALLTLVQMLAATLAGVHGIGHRHRTSAQAAGTPSTPLIRWRHGEPVHALAADAHAQLHAHGDPHDHAATDASVLPLSGDLASDAVAHLAAALAPGHDAAWLAEARARHVRAAAAAWAPTPGALAPPWRPPRG